MPDNYGRDNSREARDRDRERDRDRDREIDRDRDKAWADLIERVGRLDERVIRIDKDYVSRAEFKPIENVVYRMIWLILAGVAGGLLWLVIPGAHK